MTTVMSAIGEATGMKPDDKVVGLGMIEASKAKAQGYLTAVLATTSPDLRHVLITHLQDALTEHEHVTALAIKKGWLKPTLPADQAVKAAVSFAQPLLH